MVMNEVVPEPLGHKDHNSVIGFLQHQRNAYDRRPYPVQCPLDMTTLDIAAALSIATSTPRDGGQSLLYPMCTAV